MHFILRCDRENIDLRVCEIVYDKQVLAKGRISFLEIAFVVAFIDNLGEGIDGHIKYCPTVLFGSFLLGKLPVAKRINNESRLGRHESADT